VCKLEIYYWSGIIHGWNYRFEIEARNEALLQVQRAEVKKCVVKDRRGEIIFTVKRGF
jgi:hypothetical protein